MSRIDETIQAKTEKREQLEKCGVVIHPPAYTKELTVAECRKKEGNFVTTAGRIVGQRTHGKVTFLDIFDHSATMQVMIRAEEIGAKVWEWLRYVDRGDFIGVSGTVVTTKSGEITIHADSLTFLGKSLRPLPTEFNAAADKEVRFRKRYIDMLINPETKRVLDARWAITKEIRRYLQDEHQFVEVETPILQPLYGGTNATPFTTHMEALDTDFYLRIAPELYLKRLIVGGYDRVFEIARNFRNEGIDQTHQPEFTMIEWYEAYADYHKMMDVAEGLYKHLAKTVLGSLTVAIGEVQVDLSGSWPRLKMTDALRQFASISVNDATDDELKDLLKQHAITLKSSFTRGKAIFELFDVLVTPHLIEPIWIIDYPRDISPLAKQHRLEPDMAERFEGYVGGKEIADGWSEITDAIDQRAIFSKEQANMRSGDTEAHPLDEDFLEAMEFGMPPLGGIGIGIDRLVMFLTNTWSIREVIAFPTLRPIAPNSSGHPAKVQEHSLPLEEITSGTSKPKTMHAVESTQKTKLPSREESEQLLKKYIQSESLLNHCYMVAEAMEAYALSLEEDAELWYQTGLLHDLDWEKYPDEHPNRAIHELLESYPPELKQAIAAHAPFRTGIQAESQLDRYLFACDELSGFLHAYSLMRPEGFNGMKFSSVKKKLKDKAFAANVSRDDILKGIELIHKDLQEHVATLIAVFTK